ncbi:RNA-directed RNA polymerase L [Bienertia sinuspersici]
MKQLVYNSSLIAPASVIKDTDLPLHHHYIKSMQFSSLSTTFSKVERDADGVHLARTVECCSSLLNADNLYYHCILLPNEKTP